MNWDFLTRKRPKPGLLSGGLSALLTFGLLKLGGWQPLEHGAYNQLFHLRGPREWGPEVVVIGIDDSSLAAIGQFPWPRHYYTTLLKTLTPAAPSVIAFDIIFVDPSSADPQLASAMETQGTVILAQAWDMQGNPVTANPTLAGAAMTSGHIRKIEDTDGLTRWIEPRVGGVPSLGLITSDVYSLVSEPMLNASAVLGSKLGKQDTVDKATNFAWVNWPAPTQQAPYYSYIDVIEGKIPAAEFADKIVLVGATAMGLDQSLSTPFDRSPAASGVYLHAAVINNILQENFLQVPRGNWQLLILLMGGPILGVAISGCRRRVQIASGAGLAGGWALTSLGLFHLNYWIPTIWPMGLVGLTIAGVLAEDQLREEKQVHRQLEKLYERYDVLPIEHNTQRQKSSLLQILSYLSERAEQISQLIWKDELTQVGNRRDFDKELEKAWQQAIRFQNSVTVLICEVDFFGAYKDTYGSAEGERCLQQIANTLQATAARRTDIVTRYEGEQFAIILPDTGVAGSMHVAKRICMAIKSLEMAHTASEVSSYVSMSIGVAVEFPHQNSLPQVLVVAAGQALRQAKALGRDRAMFYNAELSSKF